MSGKVAIFVVVILVVLCTIGALLTLDYREVWKLRHAPLNTSTCILRPTPSPTTMPNITELFSITEEEAIAIAAKDAGFEDLSDEDVSIAIKYLRSNGSICDVDPSMMAVLTCTRQPIERPGDGKDHYVWQVNVLSCCYQKWWRYLIDVDDGRIVIKEEGSW